MKRREFLKSTALGTAAVSMGMLGCKPQTGKKPNILYITTDYMRAKDLPGPEAPFIHMPHLKNLMQKSAFLTNHVATCPICMPSRATMVTGQFPHKHGLWDNLRYAFDRSGPFLMRDLQDHGYLTAGIGKMHFHHFEDDFNFDYRVSHEGKDLNNSMKDDYQRFLQAHGYDRDYIHNLKGPRKIRGGQTIYDWPLDEALHHDAFVGDETVKFIQSESALEEKPWFLWASFPGPHNPWNAPKRCNDLYRNQPELPLGDWVEGELMDKPMEVTRHRYCYSELFWDVYDPLDTTEKVAMRRELKAAHYGSLSFIDEQLGKIFMALNARGLLENTMVVFTSDHGSALFDNQMLHKGAHFPSQSQVPFLVSWPGHVVPGPRKMLSSHADIYATLMEGVRGPGEQSQGKSLLAVLVGSRSHHKDFEIIESTLVSSVLTEDWLAGFHHFNGETELYDLTNDPMCHHNIANDSRIAAKIEELKGTLVSWRRSLSEGEEIPSDPFSWRSCLGPEETVNRHRANYIKQYQQLLEYDEAKRPGRVGRHMKTFLEAQSIPLA